MSAISPPLDTFVLSQAIRRTRAQERHLEFLKQKRSRVDPARSPTAGRTAGAIDKLIEAAEAELKQNIDGHEARIATIKERQTNLAAELKTAETDVATARQPVDEPNLRLYDRIATRHMPVCVPLRDGKCGGCHLKVSSEVVSAARGKSSDGKLPTCDQCGRLVYWES